MGFMEYLKELMDKKVTTPNLMTGGDDTRSVGQRLRDAGEWLPGTGDAISGYDAWEALKKGNYGEAALNAVGVLPGIPAMAGVIRKSSESMVPEFAYRAPEGYNVARTRDEKLVEDTIVNLHENWAKRAGSENDPFYKLIEEGKINADNMDDVFGSTEQMAELVRDRPTFASRIDNIGGYSGQYDRLPHWTKMLEDYRDNLDLIPNDIAGEPHMLIDLYDAHLLSKHPDNQDYYKFHTKEDFESDDLLSGSTSLSTKEQKFFDKLNDQDLVALDLNRSMIPMFNDVGENALLHALKKGNITPSSLADNRIGLTGLIDFIKQHKDYIATEGSKVPPEDILNTFDTGHQWMELKSPEQLKSEGHKMSNCVGGYCNKVEKGDSRIFSLRNAEGTPKITAEWDPRSRSFPQIFGPGNSAPKEKYRDMIDWLIGKSIDW